MEHTSYVFKVVLLLSNVFSIAPFNINKGQITENGSRNDTIFQLIRITIIYGLGLGLICLKSKHTIQSLEEYTNLIETVGVVSVSFISIGTVYFKRTLARQAIRKLQNCKTLETYLHKNLLKTIIFIQLAFLITQIVYETYTFLYFSTPYHVFSNVYLFAVEQFFVISTYLNLYQYSTVLLLIWVKFKNIHDLLNKHVRKDDYNKIIQVQGTNDQLTNKLKTVRELYYNLCTIASDFNKVYDVLLLVFLSVSFIITTLELYQFYRTVKLIHIFSTLFQIFKLLCVIVPSGMLTKEVRQSIIMLYRL